jgi:hypothetical protein
MESIIGAKSIWLQRIFIAIGQRISQQNPVIKRIGCWKEELTIHLQKMPRTSST